MASTTIVGGTFRRWTIKFDISYIWSNTQYFSKSGNLANFTKRKQRPEQQWEGF
jgi:hypothetical protein